MKNFKNFINEADDNVDMIDMPKVKQLMRLGLADTKQAALVQRVVQKLESGEELNVKERKIAQDLAKKLLDMVVGNKAIFSLARQGLQKEELEENARRDAMAAIRRDPYFKDKDDDDVKASDADQKAASKNPIMQLRRIADIEGGEMEFANKKKAKVSKADADKLLRAFDTIRKSLDKEKFQTIIGRSPQDLKKMVGLLR